MDSDKRHRCINGAHAFAAGIAVPGAPGVALGAGASVYALRGWDKLRYMWGQRSAQNGARVIDEAAIRLGMNPEELIDAIRGNPELERQAAVAVLAGSMTVLDEKIRALGRAMADGKLAEDDAKLDEAGLILAALADMEAPHIKVLHLIAKPAHAYIPHYSDKNYSHYEMPQLHRALPNFGHGLEAVHSTLARHGLITQLDFDIEQMFKDFRSQTLNSKITPTPVHLPKSIRDGSRVLWVITSLGVAVHEYLLSAA